jgi:hypothetical protein
MKTWKPYLVAKPALVFKGITTYCLAIFLDTAILLWVPTGNIDIELFLSHEVAHPAEIIFELCKHIGICARKNENIPVILFENLGKSGPIQVFHRATVL